MKAIIAMSGGVDSSVAAYLMYEQGYECMGVTMKLFANEDIGLSREHTCCSLDDVEDARIVAHKIGMSHHVFNFSDKFEEKVVENFVYCYENGMTPNPCIECNRHLKFDKLHHRMRELGYDYVVTGHYARVTKNEETGRYMLMKGLDANKDQSYVLYSLTQEQLAHTLFPLGEYSKPEIRKIAEEQNFINAKKGDSQDICFVPDGDYSSFICRYTGKEYPAGDFVDLEGNKLGTHKGIIHYTIGQRKGLGLAFDSPRYVCKIDVEQNQVVLSKEDALFTTTLRAKNINLISVDKIEAPMHIKAKVRYRHAEQPATVTQIDEDTLEVVFDEPQRAITKGQALVLYDGDVVVGGGTIVEC